MDKRGAPGRRSDYAAWVPITTRWMDNDMYGHVNNVVHYAFFDTAVNGLLIGAGVLDPMTSPLIGLVVETQCRYVAPMAFPDAIAAGVRVAHLGSSSVRYEVGLFRNEEDVASSEGHFVHVYVDRETRRPAPLPAALREYLSGLRMGGDNNALNP